MPTPANASATPDDPGVPGTPVPVTDPDSRASETPVAATDPNTYVLETPIVRGGGTQVISRIALRKPRSGELRGLSLSALATLDVDALSKVLPRITTPALTEFDLAHIDPVDLAQLGILFTGFLVPKAVKASMDFQTG